MFRTEPGFLKHEAQIQNLRCQSWEQAREALVLLLLHGFIDLTSLDPVLFTVHTLCKPIKQNNNEVFAM